MSREVTVTTPPSRLSRAWRRKGEVLGVVPLLCAQCSEEEAQVGLVAPEDVGPAEAETVIRPRTPDEPLVVDVARGLDSGSMKERIYIVFTGIKIYCLLEFVRCYKVIVGV